MKNARGFFVRRGICDPRGREMVTIHEKNSTTFDTLGLGALLPSLCTVTEELNGMYELELTHPYDAQGKWQRLEEERILYASTPAGRQPFRIYYVKPDMDGITVKARHVFYDLLDNICLSVNASGTPQAVLSAIKNALACPMPFVFTTDMTGSGKLVLHNENPVAALLAADEDKDSFVKAFGGELLRDGFTVSMRASIGENRGVAIRYGKNLVGLEICEDISEVATRIYAFGKNGVAMSGKYRDSPYINSYQYPKIQIFEDASLSYAQLPEAVQKLFDAGCDMPKVNIKADFQLLSKTEEYKDYAILEEVQLGDVVTVANIKMGFYQQAKVISYEWDALLEQYEKVELGDFVADLTASVTNGKKSLSAAVGASAEARQVYGMISGRVTINDSGLYVCADGSSTANASKLFHFGSNGLRHSSTGVNGTYRTLIDANGNISGSSGGVADAYTKAETDTLLAAKVNAVAGKQLSTEDFTAAEKNKLANIEAGANRYAHPATHSADMITGLASVATSGDYEALTNKPQTLRLVKRVTAAADTANITFATDDAGKALNSTEGGVLKVLIPENTTLAYQEYIRIRLNGQTTGHWRTGHSNSGYFVIGRGGDTRGIMRVDISNVAGNIMAHSDYVYRGTEGGGSGILGGGLMAATAAVTSIRVYAETNQLPAGTIVEWWEKG